MNKLQVTPAETTLKQILSYPLSDTVHYIRSNTDSLILQTLSFQFPDTR
jgi:hypothetical protein